MDDFTCFSTEEDRTYANTLLEEAMTKCNSFSKHNNSSKKRNAACLRGSADLE
jgi:hypothetical protein